MRPPEWISSSAETIYTDGSCLNLRYGGWAFLHLGCESAGSTATKPKVAAKNDSKTPRSKLKAPENQASTRTASKVAARLGVADNTAAPCTVVVRHAESGGEDNTTNNRMELTAVIKAVAYAARLRLPHIVVVTDSAYVMMATRGSAPVGPHPTGGHLPKNAPRVDNTDPHVAEAGAPVASSKNPHAGPPRPVNLTAADLVARKVKNPDLWARFLDTVHAARIRIDMRWVRAHAADIYNNKVDVLARTEALKIRNFYA